MGILCSIFFLNVFRTRESRRKSIMNRKNIAFILILIPYIAYLVASIWGMIDNFGENNDPANGSM